MILNFDVDVGFGFVRGRCAWAYFDSDDSKDAIPIIIPALTLL